MVAFGPCSQLSSIHWHHFSNQSSNAAPARLIAQKRKEKKRKKEIFSPGRLVGITNWDWRSNTWQRLGPGREPLLLSVGITNRD